MAWDLLVVRLAGIERARGNRRAVSSKYRTIGEFRWSFEQVRLEGVLCSRVTSSGLAPDTPPAEHALRRRLPHLVKGASVMQGDESEVIGRRCSGLATGGA